MAGSKDGNLSQVLLEMASQGWGHRGVVRVKTFYNLTLVNLSRLPSALPRLIPIHWSPRDLWLPSLLASVHMSCSLAPNLPSLFQMCSCPPKADAVPPLYCAYWSVLCTLSVVPLTHWRRLEAQGVLLLSGYSAPGLSRRQPAHICLE